ATPRPPMPPMPPMPPASWHPSMQPIARGLGFIALGTLLVLWWTGVLPFSLGLDVTDWASLDVSPGALATVDWTALHTMLFLPVVAYGAVVILQGAMMIADPFAIRVQGALEAARGVALLGFCAWLWTLSPLARAIAVRTPGEFIQQMAMFGGTPPLPLEPIVTIVVLSMAFAACGLILRGLLNLIFGHPPAYAAAPPPGIPHPHA
ncbi:MAG TPA: hypothetical protein VFW13_03885, partial [Phenylobacterium sp.]|nr:hypothetical protein [Phenylobacterium sp.]